MTRRHIGHSAAVALSAWTAACSGAAPSTPSNASSGLDGMRTVASSGRPSSADAAARPLKGSCDTTFAPIDPANAGTCSVFEAVPSTFIAIEGVCQVSHLGRSTTNAVQQLIFALDARGEPIVIDGQPVVSALRNCATFTAANGDQLRHTTTGTLAPGASPATIVFDGQLNFTGGSGRFASASGTARFEGGANLMTNTGFFTFDGSVTY